MVVVVDPLYVTLFVDDARPLATLLVHDAAYFQFGSTEVIEAPSAHSHLRHKMYSHLNGAIIGVLDDIKPSWRTWTRGDPHVAWVYVVGELPQSELSTQGARTGLLDGQHSFVSPLAATRRISVRRSPDGTGRWVPAHVLRPFIPAGVPDNVAVQCVRELIAKGGHHSGAHRKEKKRAREERRRDEEGAPPQQQQQGGARRPASAATQLPAGWVSGVDPATGHLYYHHAPSGRSQWEWPEGAGGGEPSAGTSSGGGPSPAAPKRPTKIHTRDGMMYFVDRLGPLPHEIVRTEMRGPPGNAYKVLCMRPVEPTGETREALRRSSTDATSVAPEAFVQKNELVYMSERFGQLWFERAKDDGLLRASLCEAVSRFAASYAKHPISAEQAFRSLAKCSDATPTPDEFLVLNPETQSD
mmetsp:Transcript_19408/g.60986  ORF Transcript_19408/g.60986 Transcript_19408/m.60986 type:complete len:413 (+) Transcript_19408:56-1294(+)